jgi:competence protein ComFC
MFSVLFPPTCVGCGLLGQPLCIKCVNRMRCISSNWCVGCGNNTTNEDLTCFFCKGKKEVVGIFAVWYYETILSRIVWTIKYRGERSLIPELVSHIPPASLGKVFTLLSSLEHPVFVPTPLHPRREKERGFNQSFVLANSLSALTGIPVCSDALIRVKDTHPQAQIASRAERAQNIIGAFRVVKPEDLRGKAVIMVDDIITTGSTVKEMFRSIGRCSTAPALAICVGREEATI